MKRLVRRFLLSLLIFSVYLLPLFSEKIVFSANSMTGQAGSSNTTTTLSGNAYVKTDSMEIQSDSLELSGDDYRFIKAEGHISGTNLETNMKFTCDSLSYDRVTKVAELRGNVDFQDVENNVRAQAQIIIYNQNDETAVMQIKVNLTQKDNVCTGSYAVYYKSEQLLEISGNAQVKQKDDVFRAQHISLNMDTQEISLGGNVKGSVSDSKPAKNKPVKEDENPDALENEETSREDKGEDNGEGKVESESVEKSESEA